jgi:uncharacterized protein
VTETKLIVNLTRDRCVCVGELADRPLRRMRGLMGRTGLPAGEGLLITPAPAIHTAFMRFPIDALFLDRQLRVLEIVERLRPWRVASKRGAHAVLELSAGECARRGVRSGDRLELRDRRPMRAAGSGVWDMSYVESGVAGSCAEGTGDVATAVDGRALDIYNGDGAGPGSRDGDTATAGVSAPLGGLALNEQGGKLVRLQPLRVLVVSLDRHFHTVMSLLLGRHSWSVTTTANVGRIAERIDRERIDVVLIDASHLLTSAIVVTIEALPRPVGVVLVAEQPRSRLPDRRPVLAKWGSFDELVAAIELAEEHRGTWVRQP